MGRGRWAVRIALVVALAAVPGAALGQTTTSTSTSSSTSTSTTVAATTTTTAVHPCTGRVCTEDPPGAVLSTASAQLVPDLGSYCWLSPTDGTTKCLALAVAPGYQPPLLLVTQGEVVTVRFTAPVPIAPQEVALTRAGERVALLPATNPTQFTVDLAPGVHSVVALVTEWTQGDLQYFFRLEVRPRPASPTQDRTIALTG